MSTAPTPSQPVAPRKTNKGTFYYIQFVVGIAFLLATLFTLWTNPGMLPENLMENFSVAQVPVITGTPGILPTSTPRGIPLIGVVAGHKGNDSGSICADGLTEQSVNEKVAYLVQKNLVDKGFSVNVLNEFDERLSSYQADVLVSVHADSCDYINDQATGFKVSSALANPHPERAARLTACLKNRYALVTGLPLHNSITIDMTSYHAFAEINEDTTAVIIEIGFLNLDRELLTQKSDLVAKGITDGVLCYINNEDLIVSATPTPSPAP
jgi:N-acetylmuramoyl-L-alanine amidase